MNCTLLSKATEAYLQTFLVDGFRHNDARAFIPMRKCEHEEGKVPDRESEITQNPLGHVLVVIGPELSINLDGCNFSFIER